MTRRAPRAPVAPALAALAVGWVSALIGCGPPARASVDEQYAEYAGRASLGQPKAAPHGKRAPVKAKAPLPDGWPREPVEPLPLKARTWTVMDAQDQVARFVRDFQRPGTLSIALSTRKSTGFKARVTVHDSFGGVLFEGPLGKQTTIGPRLIVPGTLYLLVQRDGGLAELGVKASFKAEKYVGGE